MSEYNKKILEKVVSAVEKVTNFKINPNQIEAFSVLNDNFIELRTGEGKTIIGIIYAVYHALNGDDVTVVTANSYLAKRDFELASQVMAQLNLNGLLLTSKTPQINPKEYNIIYTDIASFGNWYLNLLNSDSCTSAPYLTKRCIVDEFDYISIDMAQNRIQIASDLSDEVNNEAVDNIKVALDNWQQLMEKDPSIMNKSAEDKIMAYLKGYNVPLSSWGENKGNIQECVRASYNALYGYKEGIDYVVKKDKVVLINKNTGREIEDELLNFEHQALQLKHGVPLTKARKICNGMAAESLLNRFEILTGMSGTLIEEQTFINEHFNKKVIKINTNNEDITKVNRDIIVTSDKEITETINNVIVDNFKKQRPILIIAQNINMANYIGDELILKGYKINLLNGVNDANEADIMAKAGLPNRITVATTMASRGTDIVVDTDKTPDGLLIIAINHCPSARLDRQLIGRTGRQGASGEVQFITVSGDIDANLINLIGHTKSGAINETLDGMIKAMQKQNEKNLQTIRDNRSLYDMLLDRFMFWFNDEKYKKDAKNQKELNAYWREMYNKLINVIKEEALFKDIESDSITYFVKAVNAEQKTATKTLEKYN